MRDAPDVADQAVKLAEKWAGLSPLDDLGIVEVEEEGEDEHLF